MIPRPSARHPLPVRWSLALLLTLAACADAPPAAPSADCASALDPADCRACVALDVSCQATDTPGRCLAERCTGCGYCSPNDCRGACVWASDYSAARCAGSGCAAEAAADREACAAEDPCARIGTIWTRHM